MESFLGRSLNPDVRRIKRQACDLAVWKKETKRDAWARPADADMLFNFALIDLVSQRDAVRRFLRGLDADAKVEWIASHGTIRTINHSGFRLTFVFESRLGLTATFFFDDSGDFVFLGDHHTFK